MEEKEPLLNKQVIVTQKDRFVKYGELYKAELHGIWLKSDKETSFVSYDNILTIKLNPRYKED